MGLLVAMISGVFQALIGLGVGLNWKQIGVLFGTNIGIAGMAYLKAHPEDQITFDTTTITKSTTIVTPPAGNPASSPENK